MNSLTKSDQKYNNTEIAAIEKASGVKYYKTEKIVKDKSGKNSVTFLYGGPDKEMLDEYLANLELELNIQYVKPSLSKIDHKKIKDPEVETGIEDDVSSKSAHYIRAEELNRSLEKDAIGYSLHVKYNGSLENARINGNGYDYVVGYVSMDWPELLHVKPTDYSNFSFFLKTKKNGISGWKTPSEAKQIYPDDSGVPIYWTNPYMYAFDYSMTITRIFDVDGPKKVECVVDYNSYPNFYIQFFNIP